MLLRVGEALNLKSSILAETSSSRRCWIQWLAFQWAGGLFFPVECRNVTLSSINSLQVFNLRPICLNDNRLRFKGSN